MAKLVEIAKVIRSKNAKPFVLTIDILFDGVERFTQVVQSGALSADAVAAAYGVDPGEVQVIPYPAARAIKVTFPRLVVAGGFDDRDLLGAQQAVPLFDLEIPDDASAADARSTASTGDGRWTA